MVTLSIGFLFFLKPGTLDGKMIADYDIIKIFKKSRIISGILIGLVIGMIAGIVVAGGGMMILIALVIVLDYPIHKAIGTSVLIMIFTAFSCAVSHAYYGELLFCAVIFGGIGGIVGAQSVSKFANLSSEKRLKRIVGVVFMALGLILAVFKLVLTWS